MSHGPYSDEDAATEIAGNQLIRFYTVSIVRIQALMNHSRALCAEEEEHLASDVLRAAVVLLHATIEDFLRSMEALLLPYCDAKALENVPLVGLKALKKEKNENPKLHLGKLTAHRGKSVLDVIQDSVNEYLEKKTYNDKDTIENVLTKLKVDSSTVKHLYSPIELLMKRRHEIVHRGDLQNDQLTPISPEQVEQWLTVVEEFVSTISEKIIELPNATEHPS